jgi:hypothetical protein
MNENDHAALAQDHVGQTRIGSSSLCDGLDDFQPSRAWDHRNGLDFWDLAKNDFRQLWRAILCHEWSIRPGDGEAAGAELFACWPPKAGQSICFLEKPNH